MSFFGCATVSKPVIPVEAPAARLKQVEAQKEVSIPKKHKYKRKIIIGRFSNETNYGRSLMTDEQYDRIGKQSADMLATRLIKSERFLVFERPDINKLEDERKYTKDINIVGADTLIIGSVTEFGRSVGGKSAFLSSTIMQKAQAKVDIRLVDVRTGQAFFSAVGAGEASTESGEVAGFGSQADYDSTLNDRAIAAAISDVIDKLISSLDERAWRTDILEIQGTKIYISGGEKQGLKAGDILQVMQKTKSVTSRQSGFDIELPPKELAKIKVVSLFGENETNQGSIAEVVEGSVDGADIKELFVKVEEK